MCGGGGGDGRRRVYIFKMNLSDRKLGENNQSVYI